MIIPTFRRPAYLEKALRGLAAQRRPADEIVIGLRADDAETRDWLAAHNPLTVRTSSVVEPGVIASMQAAVGHTKGDIVCLLDDDAEPEPNWLHLIEQAFANDPQMGALGGRDLLQDHPEMRRAEPTTERVGELHWYGRVLGNHHCGEGGLREVFVLKGCNLAVRGELLRAVGFEVALRGSGAQVHWELALCLDVANGGWRVAYDPTIRVIHHIAPRFDQDLNHRGIFSAQGIQDMSFNEGLVMASRAPLGRLLVFLGWALAVGSRPTPGLLAWLRPGYLRNPHALARIKAAMSGRLQGIVSGWKLRRSRHLGVSNG